MVDTGPAGAATAEPATANTVAKAAAKTAAMTVLAGITLP
jgi:hypothetical protein